MKKSLNSYLVLNSVVCFLFTAVLIGIRTYQLMSFTEHKTGFYNGPSYLNYCFFGGIILLLLALFILSAFFDCDSVSGINSSSLLKTCSIGLAIFSVFYAFFNLFFVKNNDVKNAFIPVVLFLGNMLLAIGFIYLAYRQGKEKSEGYGDILLLFPVLWASFRLISIFLNNNILYSIQDNSLNVLKTCSICIFLFTMGKIFIGLRSNVTKKRLNVFGFFSLCLIFCSALPRYIINLSSGFSKTPYSNISDLLSLDFILSIFVLVFFVSYFANPKKEKAA